MTPNVESAPPTAEPDRRGVLMWLSFILGGLATLAVGIPILGYYLAPFFSRNADEWIDVGPTSEYPEGQTRLISYDNPKTEPWDGLTEKAAAYVRNEGNGAFTIFAVNCAHLGCPVSWFPQSGLFLCPCHGGVYYADGARASGPPPRGLYTYDYKVEQGKLYVKGGHLPTLQDTMKT
jgi:menaquinol-cytochrome c reductase iron-sulfur subunit